jgi:hypothetical protein
MIPTLRPAGDEVHLSELQQPLVEDRPGDSITPALEFPERDQFPA